jgi:hypothetical protein
VIGVLTALALVSSFGNAWDLYWHIVIGRDTFWIPPHTMMYLAVMLSGLTALAIVWTSTFQRYDEPDQSRLLGFRAPLGFFILGIGVAQMVASAPFDNWWHSIYGIDISVWSPPHLVGFSGAVVMVWGMIIATLAERQRSLPLSPRRELMVFMLVALLFALVVRWLTFLNSSSILVSWMLKQDFYGLAQPWAPWWGLWAGLFMTWTFVTSARSWTGRSSWALPVAICVLILIIRGLEYVVSAVGFSLVLPWGDQVLIEPFQFFNIDYDIGMWVTVFVLIPPALIVAALSRIAHRWSALQFGLASGVVFGLLLTIQFIVARSLLELEPLPLSVQAEVLWITMATSLVGGVIGAVHGDWMARFRR